MCLFCSWWVVRHTQTHTYCLIQIAVLCPVCSIVRTAVFLLSLKRIFSLSLVKRAQLQYTYTHSSYKSFNSNTIVHILCIARVRVCLCTKLDIIQLEHCVYADMCSPVADGAWPKDYSEWLDDHIYSQCLMGSGASAAAAVAALQWLPSTA